MLSRVGAPKITEIDHIPVFMDDITLSTDGKYHRWPRPAQYDFLRPGDSHWPHLMAGAYCIAPVLNTVITEDSITQDEIEVWRFGRGLVNNRNGFWNYGIIEFGIRVPFLLVTRFFMDNHREKFFNFVIHVKMITPGFVTVGEGFTTLEEWPIVPPGPDNYSKPQTVLVKGIVPARSMLVEVIPSTLKDKMEDSTEPPSAD